MKRREFVAQAAVFSAAALAAPYVIGSARAASNELSFVGFGGDYQLGPNQSLFRVTVRKGNRGIKIVQSEGVDSAKAARAGGIRGCGVGLSRCQR